MESPIDPSLLDDTQQNSQPACVLVFNASDPSGAGGLSADITAMASVGAHAVPVVTGAYTRDTVDIFGHFAFDDEAVAEQARAVLEDVSVQLIKVGFVGTPENLGVIAGLSADYADVPVIAYMPNLAWWDEVQIDIYLDAFKELVLPQTSVLIGNHSTLWRWLLPDWGMERPPSARDIAMAAEELGVPYTFVTGIPLPDQFIDNVLTSAQAMVASEKFERFEAVFSGAGDTLSAAFSALLASGCDMTEAFSEALSYLDHSLEAGFRPGMGHIVPDRLFWAQPDDDEDTERVEGDPATSISFLDHTPNDTKH
jgi:hydroxymethylpyrimidine/phosphomethylpyrimidine kinase